MNTPINLQIKRTDDTWDNIEAAPLLTEKNHRLVPTGIFQLYLGFPELDADHFDIDALRERYVENLVLMGDANAGYLGELQFTGIGFFEWKYSGSQLTEAEVLQVVDCIQDYASVNSLRFQFGRDQAVYQIRIEESEGHYAVFVDDVFTAVVELTEEEWEISSGDLYDPDLRKEVIRRINANSG
jgi:hypothetical protein